MEGKYIDPEHDPNLFALSNMPYNEIPEQELQDSSGKIFLKNISIETQWTRLI